MDDVLHLGAFRLHDKLGEGGMGVVYRGRHRRTGVDVAIKLIRAGDSVDWLRDQFRKEVQSHARLVHPHVVYLFDYGEVPADVDSEWPEEMAAASHFVAMEYARHGTLRTASIDNWPTLRQAILQILDGLAHAHARGVVHRDLKPENLLVFDGGEGGFCIKLGDFGLAHTAEKIRDSDRELLQSISGTPHYMAPEQGRGQWRRFGPWTDLYALGCIVWEILCGHPPYDGPTATALLLQHITEDFPELTPRFSVPQSLEAWLRTAMAKERQRRFQMAADAAARLPGEAPFDGPVEIGIDREGQCVETAEFSPTTAVVSTAEMSTVPVDVLAPTLGAAEVATTIPGGGEWAKTLPRMEGADLSEDRTTERPDESLGPAVPSRWDRRTPEPIPLPLVGTGLGLFELREAPFVDRDEQRALLWKALRDVEHSKLPSLVGLVGESGSGKSRLAQWLCTRARELGAARVFRMSHSPKGAAAPEGFGGMIRRAFKGWNVDRRELYEHIARELPALEGGNTPVEADARALTEIVFPTDGDSSDGPAYRFSGPVQKYAVLTRLFRRYSARRPVILWIDDVQWNTAALELCDFVLDETFRASPLLVVVTLRSDVIAGQPELRRRVEQLLERTRAHAVPIDALDTSYHRELVERMLPLEEQLAELIVTRTEGNPLFAGQLLGDWIERRYIEQGDTGFRLAEDVEFDVPDTVHQLWMDRLERVADDMEGVGAEVALRAVELAAALGREVDEREWRRVVEVESPRVLSRLRERLVERGLAERTEEGFSFSHGLLVDSIERRTREGGRFAEHHRRCAEMLEALYPEQQERIALRRAVHLDKAGELEAALEPLFVAQRRHRKQGEHRARREILERRQQLMDSLEIGDDDRRRLENEVAAARCDLTLGGAADAVRERVDRVLEAARGEFSDIAARALKLGALCEDRLNRPAEAREKYESSIEVLEDVHAPYLEADALLDFSWRQYRHEEYGSAAELLRRAVPAIEEAGDPYQQMSYRLVSLLVAIERDRAEDPAEQLAELLTDYRIQGYRRLEANCLNALGELARYAGDTEGARRWYRDYEQLGRELHRPVSVATSLLNLAQNELMARRFDSTAEVLEEYRQWSEAYSITTYDTLFEVIVMTRLAGIGCWEEFDGLLEKYVGGWPSEVPLYRDYPSLLELSAEFADEAGQTGRANRARRLAERLWDRL